MELLAYVQILVRRWWIILPTIVLTLLLTYMFTDRQEPVYDTQTTLVMRPLTAGMGDEKDIASVVNILSQRIEINTTYAEVAQSSLIKKQAAETLNLSPAERKGMSVSSRVLPSTNILQISVSGPDPVLIQRYADAISAETQGYVSDLYDVFELKPLDAAGLPSNPTSPDMALNLAVGGVLGLLLSLTLAFLSEYLATATRPPVRFDIIDSQTGVYSREFFMVRLQQEIERARRNHYVFSVALIRVGHNQVLNRSSRPVPMEALRAVGTLLVECVRTEDVLAHFGDRTFALLLPDLVGPGAERMLEEVQIEIAKIPLERAGTATALHLRGAIGVSAYEKYDIEIEELLDQAFQALQKADQTLLSVVGTSSMMLRHLTTYHFQE